MNNADIAFILIATIWIFFMTPGLAIFYGGLVRRKNVVSLMLQSFVAIGVVTVVWAVIGFTLAYGDDTFGIVGNLRYAFLNNVGIEPSVHAETLPTVLFCIFQLAVAVITPAIICGATAERFSFKAYILLLIFWSILVYAPFAHQVWGGGFLAQMGLLDFAGGTVVHMSAGFSSLAAALALGKRKTLDYTPCNMAYVSIGVGILWAGWFCFNGGSALAADSSAALTMANTFFSSASAMIIWMLLDYLLTKKVTLLGSLLGGVAGLIVVTPMSGFISPRVALFAGVLGAAVSYFAMQFRIRREWDDTLDVWALHGMSGLLGILLLGFFANPLYTDGAAGLFYGGDASLLGVQALAALYSAVYAFAVTFVLIKLLKRFAGGRVSAEVEETGLDLACHGEQLDT